MPRGRSCSARWSSTRSAALQGLPNSSRGACVHACVCACGLHKRRRRAKDRPEALDTDAERPACLLSACRLSQIGYRVGQRLIELLPLRDSLPPSTSRNATAPPRQTRLLPVLHYVHTTLFKYLFGRPASSLERSTEHEDEYMVGDDEPVLDRGVNVPKEMSSLNTNALLAGLVEAVMDGLGFVGSSVLQPCSDRYPESSQKELD